MSTIAELEALLLDVPENDEGWLVYADWLIEQDDERGRHIALDLQLARDDLSDRERKRLERENEALEKAHQASWFDESGLPPRTFPVMRHGFLWGIRYREGRTALASLEAVLAHPSARMLNEVEIHGLPKTSLKRLLGALGERPIRSLTLARSTLDGGSAKALAESEVADGLRTLDLSWNQIGNRGATALADSTHLGALQTLDLASNGIDARGARALAEARGLGALAVLKLFQNALGAEGATALAAATGLPALRSLDLYRNGIGDEGAAAIAASTALSGLTELVLSENGLSFEGIDALAKSRTLTSLASLELRYNNVRANGKRALEASATLRDVQVRI